jgi:methylmalonyl-CoA mutase
MENKKEKLFQEFPPTSPKTWEEKIIADLKGKDYDSTLIWKTIEGFNLKPHYTANDVAKNNAIPGQFPYRRGTKFTNNTWEICQNISNNKEALEALMCGVTALNFSDSDSELDALLNEILFNIVSTNFSGNAPEETLLALVNEANKRNYPANTVKGCLGFDPLGNLTITGNWADSKQEDLKRATDLIIKTTKELPMYRAININGQHFHNAGASITQELACSLAQGNEYLVAATDAGISIDDASAKLQFTFAMGPNYFMEIAKLRAARMLWARIVEQYNPEHDCSHNTYIHCTTSKWNAAIYDPHVNILRATTQAMSAIIGGCNSLAVIPFDSAYKNANEFSSRIARNVQLILQEESYLDKIADPAAGSYYVEVLTDQIAAEAWKQFQEIEANGGFITGLEKGTVQSSIEITAKQKSAAVASGELVLLGINKYPNSTEDMAKKVELVENTNGLETPTAIAPLKTFRAAEALEKERLEAEVKHG